jgi:predicted N-acyltransferase
MGMDPRVLRVFQRALADDFHCWGVIVFDESGIPVGCAALCLFRVEVVDSTNPAVVRARDRLRRFWPKLGRMKVLFCGLPVPPGSSHLRVRPDASVEKVAAEVDRVMRRLAVRVKAQLILFKELDEEKSRLTSTLASRGYLRGEILPVHHLHGAFSSFADYRDSLKSRYRQQIVRSQKKMVEAGFEVLSGRGGAFVAEHFDDNVHALYVAVQQRGEQKLELMPRSFFVDLAAALGDEVLLTLIRREGRVCGFTFGVTRGGTHHNMYSGLDYAVNQDGDLYFNLFYLDLDAAFRSGATLVTMGQTSDSFKSRLGTNARKLWFFARARSVVTHDLLRLVAPLAFPKAPVVEANDVFASTAKPLASS